MGFSTFDAALLDCAGRSFQIISLIIAGACICRWWLTTGPAAVTAAAALSGR